MKEIISRKDDEKLYQPKVHSQRIRELHQIAEKTGQPMTVLLDLALRVLVAEYDEFATLPLVRPKHFDHEDRYEPAYERNEPNSLWDFQ